MTAAWKGLALSCLFLVESASAQTNFATLVSDGAWTWYNDPRALYHNGILYFGYVRFSDGRSALNAFNPQTGNSTNLWTSTLTEKDDHDNPGLLIRQDRRMLAIYARHGTDQYFTYRISSSTNPVTAADWGPGQTLASTGAGLTYSNPYQLADEGGLVYNFMRDLNFNPTVITSSDGGTSWGTPKLLIQTGTGSIRPYVKYCSNYTNRIDFLYTDGHPRDIANSLYHMYYQAGGFYQTDGTFVTDFGNLPLQHDAGQRGSVIYQYSDSDTSDPNDHIPTGRAWCWETTYQSNGVPVCLFTVQRDQVTGTNWSDDRIYYYYARWTGTNWQKRFIAQAGRPLYASEDDYAGGICADPEDANTIYISSNASDPFNLTDTTNVTLRANERYEIWKGTTTNGGLNFTWQAVTTNSSLDNLRPYMPRNHGGARSVLWFRGVYTTFTSFNCTVVGLFPNAVPQPPSVNITNPVGRPIIITNLQNKLKLAARVLANGNTGQLAVAWSTVSGPTNAIFSAISNANTTGSFPLSGAYRLRVTATAGGFSSFDELTVQAGPTTTGSDPSLALWMKLDESSGTTAHDSAGTNNGVLSGSTTWLPSGGIRSGALDFDGLSGQVVIPDADTLDNATAFTLAYWFRADNYPGDSAGLVCKRDSISSQNAYTTYLKAADQRIYVDVDGSNNRFSSTSLINTGVWYHVGLVFDGALASTERAKLFLNGILDTTAAETSAVIPNYTSTVRLGNTHPGAVNWFDGRLDEVQFYRRALTAGELAVLGATNLPPTIALGAAPLATNGMPASLSASVLDDGRGGPVTLAWTKISGPGNASFANASNATTSVTFDHAGAYVLRLSASDSQIEVCAELAVGVAPNPNIYEDWIALAFPGVTNSSVIAFTSDPDNDSAKNLLEFALGMDPTVANVQHFAPGQAGLPVGTILNLAGTNYLALRVQRPIGRLGITYIAEVSSDLVSWSTAVQAGSPTANGDGTEVVAFRDTQGMTASSRRWMRLKIVKN